MKYNPDKDIRTAYIAALALDFIPAFVDLIPKQATPPNPYIIIHSQTKERTAIAKPTALREENYGWNSSIVFDINFISPSGFSNAGAVEDIEETLINIAENLVVIGWTVKSSIFIQSQQLNVKTATEYINRKVVTYQHWIGKP